MSPSPSRARRAAGSAVLAVLAALFALEPATAAPLPAAAVEAAPAASTATPQQKKKRTSSARRSTSTRGRSRPASRSTRRTRPAAAPAARWTVVRSAPALISALDGILSRPEDGQWGAIVVSLTRGDTLYSRGADTQLLPASTLKMYTSAVALERLGPDWRFSTDVLRDGTLAADGTLEGNLILRGDGDPSLSGRFHGGPREAPMTKLAESVAAAGVKRVKGDLIADASAFEARTVPEGWLSRYAGAGYAAPFSALSLNENIVVVAVYPDGSVKLEPATTGIRVENLVKSVGGRGQSLRIYTAADGHIVARGSIGRSAGVRKLQLVVTDPASFTAGALRSALAARGITVDGELRAGATPEGAVKVASIVSPPLSELIAVMNRESINHFAELIFRNAVRGPNREAIGTADAGNALLQQWMGQALGVPTHAVSVKDGSGLSTLDRVTARSMVELLGHAHKAPWASAFHASLPVAGESELMRRRMLATPAQGNLHAKTGTTNDVIALGGYVTAEDGEVLAFSFIFNGRDRWNARATIDAMGATLAAFARE
jgi:serine-type D-Ala-D-Ala carboxypeptidase/endopeptidase (penicillin-binding protein 4)